MPADSEYDFETARKRMVRTQIRDRGIANSAILHALCAIPRHEFVIPSDWDEAYADHPVRIGCDQTISQPYIVAYMTQALQVEEGQKVLEIGTGCGYQTAVLSALGARVYTVERHEPLSERAQETLARIGYDRNVRFRVADGTLGWPGEAPFDRILVTAAAPEVPPALKEQLADGGRMVIPVGRGRGQRLFIITRRGDRFESEADMDVIFVKLIGEQGF